MQNSSYSYTQCKYHSFINRKADTDEDTTKTTQKENENIKSLRSKVGELQQEKETLASDNKDLTRQVENLKNVSVELRINRYNTACK